MMIAETRISLFDLILCLSDVMDMVSPAVANHHKQVGFIAYKIGEELGLPRQQRKELALAGTLHDIGAVSIERRISTLQFEVEKPFEHTELGYSLLETFEPLDSVATLVRFHHTPWNHGNYSELCGKEVPWGSHILHMADRIAVLINKKQDVLTQAKDICDKIHEHKGPMFAPELVDAFMALAAREYFWLDVVSSTISAVLRDLVRLDTVELDMDGILGFTKLLARIVDFRSRFTATHSSGVAVVAGSLAKLAGFSESECRMMTIAGYLHDLGKLAVPAEILEKPGHLTKEEYSVVRKHSYYTYRTLEHIDGLDTINAWASFHHERPDGKGYPFHIKGEDLTLGARIVAAADVFTAITEDRPYRTGLSQRDVLEILRQMAGSLALDPGVVSLLTRNFDEVDFVRTAAQTPEKQGYSKMMHQVQGVC